MFYPMWEAVSRLERLGFCVLGLSCDGASPNCRLWKLHNNHDELIHKVQKREGFSLQAKAMMVLSKEIRQGIDVTGKSYRI